LIKLPEGVELLTLTKDKAMDIWDKVKNFDRLYSDETMLNEEAFYWWIYSKNLVFEVDGGIMVMDNIKKGLKGEIHASFWDKKLSSRTETLRECILWCMLEYNLYRIEARIPDFSRALRRFLEKRLGFTYEGRERNSYWYKGNLTDVIILSLLREEVMNG